MGPDRHTEGGGNGKWTGKAGARYKSRSLLELYRTSIEVERKANNVVGDVHGGVARLINKNAFVEPSEFLDREESENKNGAVRVEIALGCYGQANQRAFNWAIEGLATVKEFQPEVNTETIKLNTIRQLNKKHSNLSKTFEILIKL